MLSYYIVSALLFFAATTADLQYEKKVIQDYVTNKCLQNGGEHAFENLQNNPRHAEACHFDGLFTLRDNYYEYICGDFRSTGYSCLVAITESIELCLHNVEKFLPDFMIAFYNSTFDEFCKDEKKFKDQVQVFRNSKCKIAQDAENYIYEKCFTKSSILKDLEDFHFVIPKNAFCGYFDYANACAIDFVKDHCNVEFAELIESHLQPTEDWCDSYVQKQ